MQRPLRSKEDVLEYAALHAPSRACERAILAGDAEVEAWSNGDLPGWRVKVKSPNGRQWTIAILCNEDQRYYEVEWI